MRTVLGLRSSTRLVGQGDSDVAWIAVPVKGDVVIRVAVSDEHILDRGIIRVPLSVPNSIRRRSHRRHRNNCRGARTSARAGARSVK